MTDITVTLENTDLGTSLIIPTRELKENLDNQLTSFNQPVMGNKQPAVGGSGQPRTRVLNLLQLKRAVEFSGYLDGEENGSKTKWDERDTLRNMILEGGQVKILWGPSGSKQTFIGYLNKIEINDSQDNPDKFTVTVQVLQGENMMNV